MKFRKSQDPDILVQRTGFGIEGIFGIPFFLAGVAVMALPLIPDIKWEGSPPPVIFIILFGGVFAAVGGYMCFSRRGLKINRRSRTVTKWWGLIVPLRSSEYRISNDQPLEINKETRSNGDSSHTVYPVRLCAGDEKIIVSEKYKRHEAHQDAELVAKFLNVGVQDSSTGEVNFREAGTLDHSLRDQARKNSEPHVELPLRPEKMRASVEDRGHELFVEIPKSHARNAALMFAGVVVVFDLFVLIPMVVIPLINGEDIGGGFGVTFSLVFMMAPMLAVAAMYSAHYMRSYTIRASSQALEVTQHTPFRTSEFRIPADKLEELSLINGDELRFDTASLTDEQKAQMEKYHELFAPLLGQGIFARSDDQSVTFGSQLPKAEKQYLVAAMREKLIGH